MKSAKNLETGVDVGLITKGNSGRVGLSIMMVLQAFEETTTLKSMVSSDF